MNYFRLFEDLWEDPQLQLTLAYCESRKPYQGSKYLYDGAIVGLSPNEVLIDIKDTSKKFVQNALRTYSNQPNWFMKDLIGGLEELGLLRSIFSQLSAEPLP